MAEMNEEESREDGLKKHVQASEIGKRIMAEISVKPGMKIADIVDGLEKHIIEYGGQPAFPVNVSCNELAAHDTKSVGDTRTIGEKDVVKVDVGVHVDGYIVDTAVTVDLSGEQGKLLEAAHKALDDAIATMRAGKNTAEIGAVIENVIKKAGFKPIENLGGHSLDQYNLHSGLEIPNYAARSGDVLEEGDVIAVEPFATTGVGRVFEAARCEIFSALLPMPTRNSAAREMFNTIAEKYKTLPFAEHWIVKRPEDKLALRELIRTGSIRSYPVLKEKGNGLVSQFEHTVIVEKDGVKLLL
jgi:methionyl aminopeptidase